MDEVEIIRLNIERFRHMLETELDQSTRRVIKKILDEFESKLRAQNAVQSRQKRRIADQAGMASRAKSFLDR